LPMRPLFKATCHTECNFAFLMSERVCVRVNALNDWNSTRSSRSKASVLVLPTQPCRSLMV
jgi:hypothetical protein